jgi:4-diphosphocytidyl-2-C-methyl-D-erythritol kinase
MSEASIASVRVDCNAKINLYLHVLGKREDGFHNIETVYHSITLCDTLTLSRRNAGLTLSCSDSTIPVGNENIALRAAAKILEGSPFGVHTAIEKRIPVGAGLAGGSADAAGTLVGLSKLFGLKYSMKDLEMMAEGLGADVKFMLTGGCAIGQGRGDQLTPLPSLPNLPVVLVIPPLTIRTDWAYSSLKMGLTSHTSRLSMVSSALGKGDVASLCDLLENDFEGLIFDRYPSVGRIKEDLLGCGAIGALMSGSGPVVYGLFSKAGDAAACRDRLSGKGLDAIVVGLAGRGVTVSR